MTALEFRSGVPERYPLSPLTKVIDDTLAAFRFARHAGIAAVQDQPVVGVLFVLIGDELQQALFDFQDVFAGRQAGAVGYPEYVGIHGNGGLAESGIEDDVCRFPADPGQFFQCLPVLRHIAGMGIDQDMAGLDNVFGFCIVQADRFDILLQPLYAQPDELIRRIGRPEQFFCGFVDADIRGLRRQDNGYEQLEGAGVTKLRRGRRVVLPQQGKDLCAFAAVQSLLLIRKSGFYPGWQSTRQPAITRR